MANPIVFRSSSFQQGKSLAGETRAFNSSLSRIAKPAEKYFNDKVINEQAKFKQERTDNTNKILEDYSKGIDTTNAFTNYDGKAVLDGKMKYDDFSSRQTLSKVNTDLAKTNLDFMKVANQFKTKEIANLDPKLKGQIAKANLDKTIASTESTKEGTNGKKLDNYVKDKTKDLVVDNTKITLEASDYTTKSNMKKAKQGEAITMLNDELTSTVETPKYATLSEATNAARMKYEPMKVKVMDMYNISKSDIMTAYEELDTLNDEYKANNGTDLPNYASLKDGIDQEDLANEAYREQSVKGYEDIVSKTAKSNLDAINISSNTNQDKLEVILQGINNGEYQGDRLTSAKLLASKLKSNISSQTMASLEASIKGQVTMSKVKKTQAETAKIEAQINGNTKDQAKKTIAESKTKTRNSIKLTSGISKVFEIDKNDTTNMYKMREYISRQMKNSGMTEPFDEKKIKEYLDEVSVESASDIADRIKYN